MWADNDPRPDPDYQAKVAAAKNLRNEFKVLEARYGDQSITTLMAEPRIEYFTGAKKSFPVFYGIFFLIGEFNESLIIGQ